MSNARTQADNYAADITGVTAGTGLTGGGTSGTVTVSIDSTVATLTGSQTLTNKTLTSPVLTTPSISTIDAKGDLLVGSADNTIARLAVGSDTQVLTADSTQTNGIKWSTPAAGGMTSIASGTLSGTVVTFSSIPSTYNDLYLVLSGVTTTANATIYLTLNAYTSATNPSRHMGYRYNAYYDQVTNRSNIPIYEIPNTVGVLGSDNNNNLTVYIPKYTSSIKKIVTQNCNFIGTDSVWYGYIASTNAASVAAVSSIEITSSSSFNGGTYVLYGVK